ncbi:MAG TPA: ATP-binding protein [Pirellulales bacterium]|jgi:signal transduction histidine kinase|nr:ATP-binding protein [Pirellulales bacterium]
MSYRSFKRVLGETSLERKCRFFFGMCLLVLIAASFFWYGTKTEELVTKQNRTKGELLVKTGLIVTHSEKLGARDQFLPAAKELIANLQLLDREDETPTKRGLEYSGSFIRVGAPPNSPGQPQDAFERQLVRDFQKRPRPDSPDEVWKERPFNGGDDYVYYQGVYASKSCVGCHNTLKDHADNLADGTLMAIAKVQISNIPVQKDLSRNRAILLSTAIITVFLAMIASYAIVRYVIVKPLKHLRDVSDAISRGDIEKRAEIRTGDEFEELGVAFNRMLRHLVTVQEELRRANAIRDTKVDELAQLNMQLFEMNRLKSDFLATMSHELRTPLNSIIGFSDVLGSINSLDDKQKRYVQNIQKSGKMLLDMINDILDLAKIESGKMEVRVSEFRIDSVIAAQCDMARPLTERKNIDLASDIQPDLPALHQDQGKVQQILNNLLSNAIKFTPEGGRIAVRASRGPAGELSLVVMDTGVGIAEEDQTKIFEKFRQGNTVLPSGDAMTREYSGTGLGLSIVKELCKLLGGEISLTSELGKGSTFTVHLPWEFANAPKPEMPLADGIDDLTKPHRMDYERSLTRSS